MEIPLIKDYRQDLKNLRQKSKDSWVSTDLKACFMPICLFIKYILYKDQREAVNNTEDVEQALNCYIPNYYIKLPKKFINDEKAKLM